MKVFMLGWEFPPHISGGLGTACYGMTKGLDAIGVEVSFVLPTAIPVSASSHVSFRSPSDLQKGATQEISSVFEHVELHRVQAALQPYGNPESYEKFIKEQRSRTQQVEIEGEEVEIPKPAVPSGSFSVGGGTHYGGDLMTQINRYARLAQQISRNEDFDVIHAHDWMTFPAAMAVKATTGKPLVVQIHSTEFDRSGTNVNQQIYDIERMGMHAADKVVCVSYLTKNIVTSSFGVPDSQVEVVYNAISLPDNGNWKMKPIKPKEKIVLFLGRITMQKGPEYFLRAAKRVVEKFKDVRFVVAGSGDMIRQCVHEVADLKIGRYVTFTGFLRGDDVAKVFSMADLYVMPSVSEPFGIAPLEALSHNVPVIISKQSGVSEVLTHVLKVDFWDTEEMANKILAVLRHPPLQTALKQHGHIEMRKFSWNDTAEKLKDIYASLMA